MGRLLEGQQQRYVLLFGRTVWILKSEQAKKNIFSVSRRLTHCCFIFVEKLIKDLWQRKNW
jgi:hypothetical protein